MDKTVLQIPVSKRLKSEAEAVAYSFGFSSLQEIVRIFLKKLANRMIDITFEEKPIRLSTRAMKRYNKILKDIKEGKNVYQAKDTDDLLEKLSS